MTVLSSDQVQEAYRTACGAYAGSASGWDVTIGEIKRPIHEALLSRSPEPASTLLRDPAGRSEFWGFDAVCKAPAGEVRPPRAGLEYALMIGRTGSTPPRDGCTTPLSSLCGGGWCLSHVLS